MAERLYYNDPTLIEFDAVVASVADVGGRPAVTLDRSAFYPTSGGQPFDTGSLGGLRVVEVVESDAGDVLHVLERPLEVGEAVHGVVDWDRRLDHMQQHTGQHILSAALDRLSMARTVGFHLGADVSTVDLDKPLSAGAMTAAETEANRIVWDDRPVGIRMVSEAEAASLPLRKDPERTGTLRVIDVEGYDLSACGGTHVRRTGAVGTIAVLSSERLRGGTRLEFVCGGRALRQLRTYRDAVAGCIRHVSVAPSELPAALERLQSEAKEQHKAVRGLLERLAVHEAAALAGQAETLPDGTRLLVRAVEAADPGVLKAMALAICTGPGYRVALFSPSAPHLVVVARSKDVALDAGAAVRGLTATFGGKGGGKPDLAQGGGLAGELDTMQAAARATLDPGK
ncbi:MAG: phosphoesterase [Acidobacteria bacterium]|nr:MAG: phosphoesterase [Acidobacteriota bacterium]